MHRRISRRWPVIAAVLLPLLLTSLALHAAAPPVEARSPGDPDFNWWRKARFGLFIHWGPVALRGTEIGWSRGAPVPVEEYDQLYRAFNPTNFNAREWTRLARDTGVGYVVLTSKHHDGFCLWPSDLTDYDMASTPSGRDIVQELARACRRDRLVFALYHSILDWRHPDYPLGSPGGRTSKPAPDMDRYTRYLEGQLDELLTRYGPLGVLWFDGEWEAPWTVERGRALYQFVRARQPRILINNRVGKGREDMAGTTAAGVFAGDYDTPEQRVGAFQKDRPWESCITICQQWSWKPDDVLKSKSECLRTLVACAGGDGNLLLNIGPMPDGRIEPRQAERLREIGAWMKDHGDTLRDTRGGPYLPGAWGASTHRGSTVFLHVFQWSGERLTLADLPARVRRVRVHQGPEVAFSQSGGRLELTVPAGLQQPEVTTLEVRLDRPAEGIPALKP